jgi:hypothetical protein
MLGTIYLIGHILAITLLARIAYKVKVSGFKSYFHEYTHDITEVTHREKSILYKINSYCLVVFAVLAPIILFAYPKFVDRFPGPYETTKIFLLHLIAAFIYLIGILGGFYNLGHFLLKIWKSRKD